MVGGRSRGVGALPFASNPHSQRDVLMTIRRRIFIAQAFSAAALAATGPLGAQDTSATPTRPRPSEGARPTHDPALAREFVSACHGGFDRVKAMVAQDPK